MPRQPLSSHLFSVVVVRSKSGFLLIQERKFEQTWYLPAGRVEEGESFADAAKRETLEEAGVRIRLTGLIRIEQSYSGSTLRMRAIFCGEPVDDSPLKSISDKHSLRAEWVNVEDLDQYRLRGGDVVSLIRYVLSGKRVFPLGVLGIEGEPY